MAVDAAGDVYVVDQGLGQVVEITPSGWQPTVGSGMVEPFSVSLDGAGDLFIADWGANHIVEVQQSLSPTLSFGSAQVGSFGAEQSMMMLNIGNQPLTGGLNLGSNLVWGGDTYCSSYLYLESGASCHLSFVFSPTTTGSNSGSLVLTDNSLNNTSATQTIKLTGTAVQGQPQSEFLRS